MTLVLTKLEHELCEQLLKCDNKNSTYYHLQPHVYLSCGKYIIYMLFEVATLQPKL